MGELVDDAIVDVENIFRRLKENDALENPRPPLQVVYEPTTEEEPAHYAQGELAIPAGLKKVIIRFRIVPPDADEVTYDVPVTVE